MPDVIDNVKVGLLIKTLLKERNMTQEQLANALNISKSAVSQNLNGKSSFDIQNLMKISELFNISLDELLSQKSGGDREIISEYERLTKKGLVELKRVSPKDLNVKAPDLYGKVLVEYIMDYGNVEMFNYLFEHKVMMFNPHHHLAKKVLLDMIVFMLEKNLANVESLFYAHIRHFGSFEIKDDTMRMKIMKLLNHEKRQNIVKKLMVDKTTSEAKFLGVISYKQKHSIMTKKQWLENIALYQMHHVLSTYINLYDIYQDYPLIIAIFKTHHYLEGCHYVLKSMKLKSLTSFELRQMKAQQMAVQLSEFNDLEVFKLVIEKSLYLDIDDLLTKLIKNEKKQLYAYCLNHQDLIINYPKVLLSALEKSNLELLVNYTDKLTQDQKNYLLSQVNAYDLELIDHLVNVGAQFTTKYHNSETYTKVNRYIQSLIKKEEEEKKHA